MWRLTRSCQRSGSNYIDTLAEIRMFIYCNMTWCFEILTHYLMLISNICMIFIERRSHNNNDTSLYRFYTCKHSMEVVVFFWRYTRARESHKNRFRCCIAHPPALDNNLSWPYNISFSLWIMKFQNLINVC